jgi:hypothetical protein
MEAAKAQNWAAEPQEKIELVTLNVVFLESVRL